MPDYDAERTHAFFAAKDAIATGRDPMKAALRHLAPNGASTWIDRAIAEHAVESAKSQTVATSPYLNRRLRTIAEVEAELRRAS